MLLPLWLLLFCANYIISFKTPKKFDYIMPVTLIMIQLGFLFFYVKDFPYYSLEQWRLNFAYGNMVLPVVISFLQNKNKNRMYIVPFIISFIWLILFIY